MISSSAAGITASLAEIFHREFYVEIPPNSQAPSANAARGAQRAECALSTARGDATAVNGAISKFSARATPYRPISKRFAVKRPAARGSRFHPGPSRR
jgi:hypothetical protein